MKKLLSGFLYLCLTISTQFVSGQTLDPFDPSPDEVVSAIAAQADGAFLVGGQFTTLAGENRSYIARFSKTGDLDTQFNPSIISSSPFFGGVLSLAIQTDGKIIVGGAFGSVNGTPRNNIARLNQDGSLDTGFNPNVQGAAFPSIYSLAIQRDGKILVGGQFASVRGVTRNNVARLNTNGTLDTGFNPGTDGDVYSIGVQADGKIVLGGYFDSVGGQVRNRIARLSSNGSLDIGFNPDVFGGWVETVAIQRDDKILVGGQFSAIGGIGGQPRNNVARLLADGGIDTDFNPNATDTNPFTVIYSFGVQSDGRILLGGGFTKVAGQARIRAARLNFDGSLDSTFVPSLDDWVGSLLVRENGNILVAGRFTTINGELRNHIAQLSNPTSAESDVKVMGTGQINWNRSGSAPELSQVSFEIRDVNTWTQLGDAQPSPTGWALTGLSLPPVGEIRARGRSASLGHSSLFETTVAYDNTPLGIWRYLNFGTISNDGSSADGADPDHDGISNLMEYACNLDPKTSTVTHLTATSTAGLPTSAVFNGPGGKRLRIEFLRRRSASTPGITYAPVFAVSPSGPWISGAIVSVFPVDETWERVLAEDVLGIGQPNRFGRVQVSLSP
ncbi:MAG: delta-60 repeat domain-containing protein [Verrucomicrobia bacterium]|nr:delta-60 repeat domain-containing protein [Verrucomicrobiota bacterium]